MSSGRVHSLATSITGGISTGVAFHYFGLNVGALISAGAVIQILISPDMDVDKGDLGYYFIRQTPFVGKVLIVFWRLIWLPYARLMPHRSVWSHFPIISTLIRWGYILIWVNLISNLIRWDSWVFLWSWPIFISIVICDTVHWLMDGAPIRAINIKK